MGITGIHDIGDDMTTNAEIKPPATVLDKFSAILDAFDERGQLTLAEVAEYTGFPRSSAHRMLDSMVKLRWLCRDGRRYRLGTRLVELGSRAVHQNPLRDVALPFLCELHRLTGHVVHLGVLAGPDVVCLEKIGGDGRKAIRTGVGYRLPAHRTALGKALLSCANWADTDRNGGALFPLAGKVSASSHAGILGEMVEIRRTGHAYDRGELISGYGCVAAPIRAPRTTTSAISVCGRLSQIEFDGSLVTHLRMTALAVQRALAETAGRHSA
jgi:DNA-binding IclR family transcriptional regulator